MIRHCNGDDPNLIMQVDNQTGEKLTPNPKRSRKSFHEKPCDCGCVFDDVSRMVIWPHDIF